MMCSNQIYLGVDYYSWHNTVLLSSLLMTAVTVIESDWVSLDSLWPAADLRLLPYLNSHTGVNSHSTIKQIRGQSSHHITARAVPPCAISHNILTCAGLMQADVNQKVKTFTVSCS
mmetsp:Transcript_23243/g.37884  ORF Transcript_23243/g.37884 Transcript_23243/m.37884 type:complete len:116 (-) Transcript_23243:316-663(-)